MKKFLLATLAVAGLSTAASAQYTPGGTQIFKDGYKLEFLWANTDATTLGGCRVGTGTNDKFYLNDYANGTVKVYDELGFVKDIKVADFIWVSNNADNAGHIVVRADKSAWPGTTSYAGAGDPAATAFYVIDSKTDEVISPLLTCDASLRTAGRGDAFGHINYDVTKGFWAIYHCFETMGDELLFNGLEEGLGSTMAFKLGIAVEYGETSAKTGQTLGTAMPYGKYDVEKDQYESLAVFANNRNDVTGSGEGALGNGIRHYSLETQVVEEEEVYSYKPERKFFLTPQHADIGGFMVFELAGKQYIAYPAGGNGVHPSDALAISEVKYAESPLSNPDADKEAALVARLFPSVKADDGAVLYPAKSNYMSINVEPVADDPNSVYIYTFAQQGAMVKCKFTAPEGAGVEDLVVSDDENAPVEYYNLQGIRVANPENGIFIRRQGSKATKVIL